MDTELAEPDDQPEEALQYEPSKVEWATAQFVGEPPSLARRAFLYFVLIVLVLALVYAKFAKVPVVVEAQGSLTTAEGVLPIRAPVTFTVKELLIRENETVKKDQLLALSADHLSDKEAKTLLDDAKRITELLEKDRTHQCGSCAKDLARLAKTAFTSKNTGPIRQQLTKIRHQLREVSSARSLFANRKESTASLRRRITVAQKKIAEIKRRGATNLLALKVEELQSEIVAARAQIADREQGGRKGIESLKNTLAVQLTDLQGVVERYRSEQAIRAPIAGVVTDLTIRAAGQLVTEGDTLMRIVPKDARIVAALDVANRDISSVKNGMEVRIKLDALPEREYGPVIGSVKTVPVTTSKPGADDTYRIVVALEQQSVKKGGKTYPFRLGMKLTGLIVSRYESMLTRLAQTILQAKDEVAPGSNR